MIGGAAPQNRGKCFYRHDCKTLKSNRVFEEEWPVSRVLSDDFKELVRSRTDIVGLIGESVALQSRGREFVGLCPFHDDHNPSLRVYPDRQSYRCWSCNEGGDCFSFVMKHERLEFREALEMLASRANL